MHNDYGDEPKWEGYRYDKDRLRDPSDPAPDYKCLEGKPCCSGCGARELELHHKDCSRLGRFIPQVVLATDTKGAHRSDGGSTDYYAIPPGTRDLDDLIDSLGMSFRIANIFKACMRFGKKDGTSQLYDLNKIIFFATREKNKLLASGT